MHLQLYIPLIRIGAGAAATKEDVRIRSALANADSRDHILTSRPLGAQVHQVSLSTPAGRRSLISEPSSEQATSLGAFQVHISLQQDPSNLALPRPRTVPLGPPFRDGLSSRFCNLRSLRKGQDVGKAPLNPGFAYALGHSVQAARRGGSSYVDLAVDVVALCSLHSLLLLPS